MFFFTKTYSLQTLVKSINVDSDPIVCENFPLAKPILEFHQEPHRLKSLVICEKRMSRRISALVLTTLFFIAL